MQPLTEEEIKNYEAYLIKIPNEEKQGKLGDYQTFMKESECVFTLDKIRDFKSSDSVVTVEVEENNKIYYEVSDKQGFRAYVTEKNNKQDALSPSKKLLLKSENTYPGYPEPIMKTIRQVRKDLKEEEQAKAQQAPVPAVSEPASNFNSLYFILAMLNMVSRLFSTAITLNSMRISQNPAAFLNQENQPVENDASTMEYKNNM